MPVLSEQNRMRLAQMSGGTYGKSVDFIPHTLFDTSVISTTNEQIFFTDPQNPSAGKDETKTNLRDNGKLPEGQAFGGGLISFDFLNKGVGDALVTQQQLFIEVMQNSTLEIRIPGREFEFQVPGSRFMPNMTGAAVSASTIIGGYMVEGSDLAVEPAVIISQRVSFSARWYKSADVAAQLATLNTAGCAIRWNLIGELTRRK